MNETNLENVLEDNQSSDSEFKEESGSESEDDVKKERPKKRKKEDKPLEICKVCNEPLPNTITAYNKHISTHDPGNPTPFECNRCDKKYKTSRQLRVHVKAHDFHINCNFCNEKFRTTISRDIHERRTHTFIKPYKCDKCVNTDFLTITELFQHKKRHHLPKKFSCDICQKKFPFKPELTHHKKTHTKERDFQCTKCGKNFMNETGVRTHERRVHSTEEKFFCDKCSLSFCKKPELYKHNRTVHNFEESPCDVCGKIFNTIDLLRKHKLYHDEEYKFSCPVCPTKNFARMYLLRRHIKASHPTVELPATIRKIGKKSKLWRGEAQVTTN